MLLDDSEVLPELSTINKANPSFTPYSTRIGRVDMSAPNATYYDSGSTQVATLSAVLLKKLEQRRVLTKDAERLVIVLVGLPGRGKSFIARKLQSFLTWRGSACKVFNVGKYRRQVQATTSSSSDVNPDPSDAVRKEAGACNANFFDSHNAQANALRQEAAEEALKDMLDFLDKDTDEDEVGVGMSATPSRFPRRLSDDDGIVVTKKTKVTDRVAIYDATNSTAARRSWLLEQCTSPEKRGDKTTGIVFVESLCDDEELLEENFRFKVRNSPDFAGMTEEEAINDLRLRVQKYEEQYQTIEDDNLSYIKIYNLSSKLLVNLIYGRCAKVIVPCLMSWNIGSRPIYLCRAGETEPVSDLANTKRKGTRGDHLGPKGHEFRRALASFIEKEGYDFANMRDGALREAFAPRPQTTGTSKTGLARTLNYKDLGDSTIELPFNVHILTSTMPRAVETATWEEFPFQINQIPNLNPLDKGDFSGMELDEIKEKDPEWYSTLEKDPYRTRFPGGECYRDLIHRLEGCVIDMEQQVNMVTVVSHLSVLQALVAYFRRSPVNKCSSIQIPMHTVIKFTPVTGGGWVESQHLLLADDTTETHTTSNAHKDVPIWGDKMKRLDTVNFESSA